MPILQHPPKTAKYQGAQKFYDYGNGESTVYQPTCCGQAAVLSYLTNVNNKDCSPTYPGLDAFVKKYPPDNFFGMLGSSVNRLTQTLNAFGYHTNKRKGWSELRKTAWHTPCLVMLEVQAAGWPKWGLHWVCVYGFDSKNVYLTNWWNNSTHCPIDKFKAGWNDWSVNTLGWFGEMFIHPY